MGTQLDYRQRLNFVPDIVKMSDAAVQSSPIPGVLGQAWIDQVEKEFDKAFVSLDILLGEVDSDQITYEGRQKMTALSSCFAQLLHKTQTLHHALSRVQNESNNLRDDLVSARTVSAERHKESQQLLVQVHSLQCELHSKTAPHESDMIKKKLDLEINAFRDEVIPSCGNVFVGDAILSVNGIDLRTVKHQEAVEILSTQQGDLELELVFVSPDEDSDDDGTVMIEDADGTLFNMYNNNNLNSVATGSTGAASSEPQSSSRSSTSSRPNSGGL
ncbi:unnamed protein product, partial [Mesorhabditis spiculigera]